MLAVLALICQPAVSSRSYLPLKTYFLFSACAQLLQGMSTHFKLVIQLETRHCTSEGLKQVEETSFRIQLEVAFSKLMSVSFRFLRDSASCISLRSADILSAEQTFSCSSYCQSKRSLQVNREPLCVKIVARCPIARAFPAQFGRPMLCNQTHVGSDGNSPMDCIILCFLSPHLHTWDDVVAKHRHICLLMLHLRRWRMYPWKRQRLWCLQTLHTTLNTQLFCFRQIEMWEKEVPFLPPIWAVCRLPKLGYILGR